MFIIGASRNRHRRQGVRRPVTPRLVQPAVPMNVHALTLRRNACTASAPQGSAGAAITASLATDVAAEVTT